MEVKIELGHKACKNIKTTKEGYTHDWTVFVQGVNSNEIKHIVEKVIFHLPDTYPDPHRVREKPPYCISESSSQGLSVEIDVFFCPEAKLKKVHYVYDIFISDEAVNISWERKVSFPNPSQEFKEKLLLAGGKQVDLLDAFPVMTGEIVKIKEEPVDEIPNNVDKSTLNTAVQQIDNLQNNCSRDRQRELDLNKLLEENKKLKKMNAEIKEKINVQQKLMADYKENISAYETNILNSNSGIDQLKKKLEAEEKEINSLRLQLRMLQVKNKIYQTENAPQVLPENRTRGAKRKNEDLNISSAVGNEKENVIEPTNFLSSQSSTSQNQNIYETGKSNGALSFGKSTSVSEAAGKPHSKNATQALNDSFNNNTPEIIMIDVGKSAKKRWPKIDKRPELVVIDDQKHAKRKSVKASSSKKTPEIITIDDEDSVVGNSAYSNASLNKSDTHNNGIKKSVSDSAAEVNSTSEIIIDTAKSRKKNSANVNASLNKSGLRNRDVGKMVEGNSHETSTSVNIMNNVPCGINKTQEQSESLMQEHHASSSEKTNKSLNANCIQSNRPSNCDGARVSPLTQRTAKSPKRKKKKKLKKTRDSVESNSLETSVNKSNSEPCSTNQTQKQHSSLVSTTDVNSSNSNCEVEGQKFHKICDVAFNPETQRNKKQIKKQLLMEGTSNDVQSKTLCINPQDLNDTSAPTLISFLTEHSRKLASEIERIKKSEFGEFRKTFNLLFFNLRDINTLPVTNEYFFQHVHSLITYFSDPRAMDMPTLIYLVVDYLSRNTTSPEGLLTYIQNGDTCVFLQPSENCIVHVLFEIERRSLPHLYGLIRNTLNIISEVLISKKRIEPNGLASLCRVYMEISKCNNNRWEPLFLCCELLKLEHPLAPYLISCLASVWRVPFYLQNKFSVPENMLLGSIHYGMKDKPISMDSNLWLLTVRLRSTYFPHPLIIASHHAIQFLKNEIFSRCEKGLFQDLWMLASPLIIYVSKEPQGWKKIFKFGYLHSNLSHFSKGSNEQGFDLFCYLYVDILSLCPLEDPFEHLLQYFSNPKFHKGKKFVRDCAAVALLKYIGIADKHIPAPLRKWFQENQYDPKVIILIHLFCKKVMESEDSFIKWDDIIIV